MADKTMGLLVDGFERPAAAADEFDAWYNSEQIPAHERVRGVVNSERWVGVADSNISIAIYDLDSLAVLQSAAYRATADANPSPGSKRIAAECKRVFRFEAEALTSGDLEPIAGAGGLMMFAMNVAPEAEADFNDWYSQEHVPSLAAVPGCMRARRFRIVNAMSEGRQRYLAVYHLESPDVCSSEPWKKAIETPWTHRIRPHQRDRLRLVLRRYTR
jgi:hypothetical protein